MVIWVKHLTKRFFEGTVTKGWCFIQCFGSEFFSRIQIDFFPESGSGSAKTPDPVRKKRPKTGVKVEIFISTRFNTVLFGKAPPKPYQNYHLDPISLLMDGSGSAKKPGSIRIRITVCNSYIAIVIFSSSAVWTPVNFSSTMWQACCTSWVGRTLCGCWRATWRRRRSCAWRRRRRQRRARSAARSPAASARCSRSSGWRGGAAWVSPPLLPAGSRGQGEPAI